VRTITGGTAGRKTELRWLSTLNFKPALDSTSPNRNIFKYDSMLNKIFSAFPMLKTERLTLRQLEIADEQEIFTLRSDSEINKYLDRQLSNTINDARNFIKKINESVLKNDSLYWAVTLNDSHVLIGTICLFGFSDENESCEIGYELLTNFQRQGIMTEAVEKVIDYAFHTIQLKKMEAFIHKSNQSSIKLLERHSFINSDVPGKTEPELVCFQLTNSMRNS
jgi:ribosomal-protein-alanine N-acetyltransferase